MSGLIPDPFEPVRRLLNRTAQQALDRAIAAAAGNALNAASRTLASQIDYVTGVLGRLSHGMADMIADSFRGPGARPLTRGEVALVTEAFGSGPLTTATHVVNGSGRQPLADMAFLNGNPAITIGNTIYIKPSIYRERSGHDLSRESEGVALLLHEYTHVIQYDRLGFTRFGKTYAAEFRANGYDANRMYRFWTRDLHYDHELIEGQAEMVGRYAEQRALPPEQRNQKLITMLRRRLQGTGIYGH